MISIMMASLALSLQNPAETGLEPCAVEFIILGVGQDAGAPQIANPDDPAWDDPSLRMFASSAALIDHKAGKRYLFEATPFITDQLQVLDELAPSPQTGVGLDGVFITHAHMGHYGGLLFLGFEAANAASIPVYAMPRLKDYFETNGPWSQLVGFENIALQALEARTPTPISTDISVTPYRVPHRDEYSETVGYVIETEGQDVLFLPDLDSWDEWEDEFGIRIEDMITEVDYAFVDATFFDDNELPGRDMSVIPHPRVRYSMDRFDSLAPEHRSKVHFIHFNHTNPVRYVDSEESQLVIERGYNIARRADRHCLVP